MLGRMWRLPMASDAAFLPGTMVACERKLLLQVRSLKALGGARRPFRVKWAQPAQQASRARRRV
jgi:hypothetical protein